MPTPDLGLFNSKVRAFIVPHLSEALEGHPINLWDVDAMGVIYKQPGCNMKDICLYMSADKGRMSLLINKLIKLNLVKNRSNGKSYILFLTEEGEKEYLYAKEKYDECYEILFSKLTDNQIEILDKLMSKIIKIADQGYKY